MSPKKLKIRDFHQRLNLNVDKKYRKHSRLININVTSVETMT